MVKEKQALLINADMGTRAVVYAKDADAYVKANPGFKLSDADWVDPYFKNLEKARTTARQIYVTFKDGSHRGNNVVINEADFDDDKHILIDYYVESEEEVVVVTDVVKDKVLTVTFNSGMFDGKPVVINEKDFDSSLHKKVHDVGKTYGTDEKFENVDAKAEEDSKAEELKQAEATKPVEVVETVKPAETVKPTETVKPVESFKQNKNYSNGNKAK